MQIIDTKPARVCYHLAAPAFMRWLPNIAHIVKSSWEAGGSTAIKSSALQIRISQFEQQVRDPVLHNVTYPQLPVNGTWT